MITPLSIIPVMGPSGKCTNVITRQCKVSEGRMLFICTECNSFLFAMENNTISKFGNSISSWLINLVDCHVCKK